MSQDHTSKGLSELSLEQYQEFFINAPIGIITTAPEGQLISANPAMARMFGYDSPDELIVSVKGLTTQLYVDPADREELMRLLKENDEVLNYECRGIRRDGTSIWTSINVSVVRDKDGKLIHFQSFLTEITERKQAEYKLHESEERYREMFENTFEGIAIYKATDNGSDFVFVDLNKQGAQIDNIDKQKVIGKKVTHVFPKIKDFGLLDVFKRVYETGKSEYLPTSQYEDKRITGWRENFVYKIVSGQIVAVYRDVTERKQAEQALWKNEQQFRTLFMESPVSITIHDKDSGEVVDANPKACTSYGLSSVEELKACGKFIEPPY